MSPALYLLRQRGAHGLRRRKEGGRGRGREEGRKGGRLGRGMVRSFVGHRETNTGIPSAPSLRGDDLHACEWREKGEKGEKGEGREERRRQERREEWYGEMRSYK